MSIMAGASWFSFSRSSAIGHLIKPQLRLRVDHPVHPRLRIGGEVVGVASSSLGTAVAGVMFIGRAKLWSSDEGWVALAWGMGVGHGAAILDDNLLGGGAVSPYGYLGVETRWQVTRHIVVSAEVLFEHLSVVTLSAGVGWNF